MFCSATFGRGKAIMAALVAAIWALTRSPIKPSRAFSIEVFPDLNAFLGLFFGAVLGGVIV